MGEIRQFALFILGDKCDPIIEFLKKVAPQLEHIDGGLTCFDVASDLKAGFFFLALASVLSWVVIPHVMGKCSLALLGNGEDGPTRIARERAESLAGSSIVENPST